MRALTSDTPFWHAGEKVWRMPVEDSYWEIMKSPIADMKNAGSKCAGCARVSDLKKGHWTTRSPSPGGLYTQSGAAARACSAACAFGCDKLCRTCKARQFPSIVTLGWHPNSHCAMPWLQVCG